MSHRPFRFGRAGADPSGLLDQALALTLSEGWMADAIAVGGFVPSNAGEAADAVMVLQNLTTLGGEVHFGLREGAHATPRLVRGFMHFAFRVRRLPMVVAPVFAWNAAAQVMALKAGFRVGGYLASARPGRDDVVVLRLAAEDCRWVREG